MREPDLRDREVPDADRAEQAFVETLGLDPDGSLLDFADDVEGAFEMKFDPAVESRSLGDIYLQVLHAAPREAVRAGACATMMVFHAVRRALSGPHERAAVKPTTSLASVASGRPLRFFRRVARATGLRLPTGELTAVGVTGVWTILGAVSVLAIGLFGGAGLGFVVVGVVSAGSGALLVRLDPGRFPRHLVTIGDLVEHTAPLNRGPMRSAGARVAMSDDWELLVAIASDHSGIAMSRIGPGTTLLQL